MNRYAVKRPGLLLDRDGVINVNHGFVSRWEDFDIIPGAERLISAANRAGWGVAICTNQSGVARGFYTENEVHALHDRLRQHLAGKGEIPAAWIDAIYHCPFMEGASVPEYDRVCPDRKPAPGMLLKAIADMSLDPGRTVMIGDSTSDMQAAGGAGVRGLFFQGGNLWEFAVAFLPELAAFDRT